MDTMPKTKQGKSGFTLIEMLVVVAIIGLLSSVVLNALGPARNKAKDARIMQEVGQVRDIAETVYNGHYPESIAVTPGVTPSNGDLASLDSDIATQGGELHVVLSSDSATFIAYSKLNTLATDQSGTEQTQYYCLDSGGKAVFLLSQPNDAAVGGSSPATCE